VKYRKDFKEAVEMQTHRAANAAIAGCFFLFLYLILVPTAQAGIFYDFAVKGTYEDNVVGLLSDKRGGTAATPATGPGMMGKATAPGGMGGMGGGIPQDTGVQSKGDFSMNIFADIGGSTNIASRTYAFLIGSAQHTSYNSFNEFDNTIGGLTAGIDKDLGDIVTVRLAVNGSIKRYQDSQRDASAFGPIVTFKEQFTPLFWVKESYYYEMNNADSAFFTYKGNFIGIWGGYLALPKTTFLLGYNYLVRDYDEPVGFQVTAQTVSASVEHEFAKRWFIDAQYDHQMSDSNVPGTSSNDNIFSLGVRFSY
jgi:hypothetical protein